MTNPDFNANPNPDVNPQDQAPEHRRRNRRDDPNDPAHDPTNPNMLNDEVQRPIDNNPNNPNTKVPGDPTRDKSAEPRADTSAMVKAETPTSHGMMWTISSPTGGVLAMVRDEAAADMVLTALAAYTPPAPPEDVPLEGWMSEQEISERFEESQKKLRDAGQIQPRPDPRVEQRQQQDLAQSPTRHTMPDEPPDPAHQGVLHQQQDMFAETPQPHEQQNQQWANR